MDNLCKKYTECQEYEIINDSDPIYSRSIKTKLTWEKYIKKIYNITLIVLISAVIYIYYIYGKSNKKTEKS